METKIFKTYKRKIIDFNEKLKVCLIDRCGETTTRYTPLGIMYLKAAALENEIVREATNINLLSFNEGNSISEMIETILNEKPDVVGFSCQGWNFKQFETIIYTIQQSNPNILIFLGGNHVSYRARNLLNVNTSIDLIINGEGEETFVEVLEYILLNSRNLLDIKGISFLDMEKNLIENEQRPRIRHLESVPSPYLASEEDIKGYDIALLETNRGCPYHCSFCFWGGAVGQKMAKPNLARVRAELEVISKAGIPSIFVCDSNFGILKEDIEIAHMIVEMYKKYGVPDSFHVNWAKNNASRIREIIKIIRDGGIQTNMYLALQTLDDGALKIADRPKFGRDEMFDLALDMVQREEEVGCELIFGLPGETIDVFKGNYDKLFLQFPKMLVHPLWILPNTKYDQRRKDLGLITIKADSESDYEGVLSHNTLSIEDNRDGLAFLLAEDMLLGTSIANSAIRAATILSGIEPSEFLNNFEQYVYSKKENPLARKLTSLFSIIRKECFFQRYLRNEVRQALFADKNDTYILLCDYIDNLSMSNEIKEICKSLAHYNINLLPRKDLKGTGVVDTIIEFPFDVHKFSNQVFKHTNFPIEWFNNSKPVNITIRHKAGHHKFSNEAIDLTSRWMGKVVSSNLSELIYD